MSRSSLAALLAALASTVALAIPAVASADVAPPEVNGDVLTVVSDDEGDPITLTVANGVLVSNNEPSTLAPSDAAEIIVEAGGGNDVVDASALLAANYGTLRIEGGAGDDVITGGNDNDDLFGDEDNDRLVGFKGNDEVFGGAGDDVMVWNNGDNTDKNDGEAGFDESEVNGHPAARDEITYTPGGLSATHVLLERVNLIGFEVELSAERLTVNGLGGADLVRPVNDVDTISGRTALVMNGGPEADELVGDGGGDVLSGGAGNDQISSRGGADTLNGGDGQDALRGEDGDDRLVGDRGADSASGEAGNDVLVWNNGDGSDENDGAAGFDRVEFNGSTGDATGDVLSLAIESGVTTLRRTNLVPVTVEMVDLGIENEPHGGIEAVSVNGLGGGDNFTVANGLASLLVSAEGGPGNDVLKGAAEADSFFGGPGADMIDPGAGSDLVDGQDGNDELFTRDSIGDLVRGGLGVDSAQTDAATVDAVDGVEKLDRPLPPPVGDTRALLPRLGKATAKRSGRALVARVPLTCPATEAGGCAVTATLQTAGPVRIGKVRAPLVLGSKAVRLAAGQRSTVTIRLAAGADQLAKGGNLRVRLRLDSTDKAGNSATASSVLRLKVSAPPRGRS